MVYRYALHPQELAVNESEHFYAKMAAKGWHHVKRGVFLSRFQRAEPREMQYRIVVVMPATSEGLPFSAEQMAVYENSGWEFITGQGFIYMFRTPHNSGASELCLAPDQQEETIKNRTSRVVFEQSLLSRHWNTYEVVDVTGNEVWMQQDVYHLKNSDMTARLVESLMKDGVFTDSIEDFTEVDISGLDYAWISEQLECIAVKEDYVCFVTYPEHGREELISILQAVAEKWA